MPKHQTTLAESPKTFVLSLIWEVQILYVDCESLFCTPNFRPIFATGWHRKGANFGFVIEPNVQINTKLHEYNSYVFHFDPQFLVHQTDPKALTVEMI